MPVLRWVPTPEQARTVRIESVDARPPCEKEIGSQMNGWHACGKPAKVYSDRELSSGGRYRIYYCERHRAAAEISELPHVVRILDVGEVSLV